jgi:hypothetical protein
VIEKAVAFEIGRGQKGEAALFGEIDRFGGVALFVALPSLHFHENDGPTVNGDEVQLPQAGADSSSDDSETTPSQIPSRDRFPAFAQGPRAKGRRKPMDEAAKRIHEPARAH